MDRPDDIFDIYQGVSPGIWTLYWPWIVALLLALIIGLIAVRMWMRKRQQVQPIEPDFLARSRLERLDVSGADLSPSQYMAALSSILRDYLQAQFGIPASSLTTDELTLRLPAEGPLSTNKDLVIDLLVELDSRRFTAEPISNSQRQALKQQTLTCIEQLAATEQTER